MLDRPGQGIALTRSPFHPAVKVSSLDAHTYVDQPALANWGTLLVPPPPSARVADVAAPTSTAPVATNYVTPLTYCGNSTCHKLRSVLGHLSTQSYAEICRGLLCVTRSENQQPSPIFSFTMNHCNRLVLFVLCLLLLRAAAGNNTCYCRCFIP